MLHIKHSWRVNIYCGAKRSQSEASFVVKDEERRDWELASQADMETKVVQKISKVTSLNINP
jgi:hypothetical protein